jgi:hypothetical protein
MQSWWDTQKDIGRIIVRISSKIWNDEKRESDEKKRVSDIEHSLRQLCERNHSCLRVTLIIM